MTTNTLKEEIRRELPNWLRTDPELRRFDLELAREQFADRLQTEGRFETMLAELAHDREAQQRKWAAQERRWEEQTRDWKDHQEKVWAEFRRIHEENRERDHRFERSVGALGSRWGLQSERAFRDALAGILEESFGVDVVNVNDYDDTGEVFGRPEQIELDVIIKNGLLIICELKSSIDKAGMYIFERKARFYEKRHGRSASRLIVISPMIDAKAKRAAERLGIETYGDSLEIESL
jgi:hypothetical protein